MPSHTIHLLEGDPGTVADGLDSGSLLLQPLSGKGALVQRVAKCFSRRAAFFSHAFGDRFKTAARRVFVLPLRVDFSPLGRRFRMVRPRQCMQPGPHVKPARVARHAAGQFDD